MTVSARIYGLECILEPDGKTSGGTWRTCERGVPVAKVGDTAESFRYLEGAVCPKCNRSPTAEGYDACLGWIPLATATCCGHGHDVGRVTFEGDVSTTAIGGRPAILQRYLRELPIEVVLDLAIGATSALSTQLEKDPSTSDHRYGANRAWHEIRAIREALKECEVANGE